jgi:hypothetical protein
MISGNHDSDERLKYGSRLFETSHIFISAKFDGSLYRQTLKTGGEEADIYLLPFVKASQVRHFYPDCLPMGAGTCRLCRLCTYPDRPCRHPDRMVASMEAYGLLVSDVAVRSGLGYNYGENTMCFTSCVLID